MSDNGSDERRMWMLVSLATALAALHCQHDEEAEVTVHQAL